VKRVNYSGESALGELLLASRPSVRESISFVIGSALAAGMLFFMVYLCGVTEVVPLPGAEKHLRYYGAVLFALFLTSCYLYLKRNTVCYYRGGVEKISCFGTRRLALKDIETLSYKASRYSTHGVYDSTIVSLRFLPRAASGMRSIAHNKTVRERCKRFTLLHREFIDPLPLSEVCAYYAKALASALRAELASGREVEWCSNVRLAPEGLRYGSPVREARYESISAAQFKNGSLELSIGEDKGIPLRIRSSVPNFWVGFHLLRERLQLLLPTDDGAAESAGQHIPGG